MFTSGQITVPNLTSRAAVTTKLPVHNYEDQQRDTGTKLIAF